MTYAISGTIDYYTMANAFSTVMKMLVIAKILSGRSMISACPLTSVLLTLKDHLFKIIMIFRLARPPVKLIIHLLHLVPDIRSTLMEL